jgi:hypothetical protein
MKHDKIDMGHIENQGEDEKMIAIENSPNKSKNMKLI